MTELKLNKKHKRFADILLADQTRNAKQAYLKVYPKTKPSVAKTSASRLLTNANLSAYIELHEKKLTEKTEVTAEYIALKLKSFLEADISNYFDIKSRTIWLKDISNMPPEIRACIEEISQTKEGFRIKLVNKLGAVAELIKLLGLAKKPDVDLDDRPTVNIVLKNYLQQNNQYVNQIIQEAKDRVK